MRASISFLTMLFACGSGGSDVSPDATSDAPADSADAPVDGPTTPSGLDPTFGIAGVAIDSIEGGHDFAECFVAQSGARTVTVGRNADRDRDIFGPELSIVLMRFTSDGARDSTFGIDGLRVAAVGARTFAFRCARAPGDKIVVVGTVARFDGTLGGFVMRFTADGALDTNLGGTGHIVEPNWQPTSVAVQADGKIVATGKQGTLGFAVTRFAVDGTRDAGFGTAGIAGVAGGSTDGSFDIAIQSDGKLVAVGKTGGGLGRLTIARFLSSGALDPDFAGGAGFVQHVETGIHGRDSEVDVDAGGGIVVFQPESSLLTSFYARYTSAGVLDTTFGTSGTFRGEVGDIHLLQVDGAIAALRGGAGLVRYSTTGVPETSFGTGGGIAPGPTGDHMFLRLAVRHDDGSFVLGGERADTAFDYTHIAASRTDADGKPQTFGGRLESAIAPEVIAHLGVDSAGGLHAWGFEQATRDGFHARFDANGTRTSELVEGRPGTPDFAGIAVHPSGRTFVTHRDPAVLAFLADGTPDPTWGTDGLLELATIEEANATALVAESKLLVAGSFDDTIGLVQLAAAGQLDPSFGTGGTAIIDLPSTSETAIALAARSTGTFDLVARTDTGLTLLRVLGDGTLDPTYVATSIPLSEMTVRDVIALDDGATIIIGDLIAFDGSREAVLVRHGPAGTLDPAFGVDGVVRVPIARDTIARGLATAGGIVVGAGVAHGPDQVDIGIRRFSATTGELDPTFGTDGALSIDLGPGNDTPFSLALQNGKVIVGGQTWTPTRGTEMVLIRLL